MAKIVVNDTNFNQEVLEEQSKPVLVDFWAVWCYPCRTQGPIVDEIATELGDKLKVAKIEVDESPEVSQKYNVLSIPTLAIFKKGEMVWQGVGLHQKPALLQEINKHIG